MVRAIFKGKGYVGQRIGEAEERIGYRMSRKLDEPIRGKTKRHRMTTVRVITLALLDSVVLSSSPDVNQ